MQKKKINEIKEISIQNDFLKITVKDIDPLNSFGS